MSFDDEEFDSDDNAYVLELWVTAFAYFVTESLEIDAELARRQSPDFSQVGGQAVLMLLLARDQGVPRAELAEMSREIANEGLPPIKAHKACGGCVPPQSRWTSVPQPRGSGA